MAWPITSSPYGGDQPPCWKPSRVSSSARPGACMTPSKVTWLSTTTWLIRNSFPCQMREDSGDRDAPGCGCRWPQEPVPARRRCQADNAWAHPICGLPKDGLAGPGHGDVVGDVAGARAGVRPPATRPGPAVGAEAAGVGRAAVELGPDRHLLALHVVFV